MSDVPFYLTRIGARFYEHTVPDLVRQLARLNDNLERLARAADPDETDPQGELDAEEQHQAPGAHEEGPQA